MTGGQVQGKWVLVQNNGEFGITELELAGSNCNSFLKEFLNLISMMDCSTSVKELCGPVALKKGSGVVSNSMWQ